MSQDSRAEEFIKLRGLGWSNEQIAERANIKPASVRRTINLYKQFSGNKLSQNDRSSKNAQQGVYFKQDAISVANKENNAKTSGKVSVATASFNSIQIAESIADVEKPMVVPTNDCVVFGDTHIPMHNVLMLRRAVHIRNTLFPHIRDLLVGGDAHNFDKISDHPKNAPGVATEYELDKSSEVWHDVAKWFDRLWFIPGNHDERIAKKVNDDISLKRLFGMVFTDRWPNAEFHFTNLDYAYIGDKWIAGHPDKYSAQPGKKPADLSPFYERNAISFHNHIVGAAQDKTGTYIGIDAGHMTDPEKHFYSKRRFNGFTRWRSGFVIISNGFHYQFTDLWTDWERYGC